MPDKPESAPLSALARLAAPTATDAPLGAVRPLLRLSAACIEDATALIPALAASGQAQAALIAELLALRSTFAKRGRYSRNEFIALVCALLDGPLAQDAQRLHAESVRLLGEDLI